jgi:hypothetical protein
VTPDEKHTTSLLEKSLTLLLLVALGLIVWMASISVFNAHPDEINHGQAVTYYLNRWLPNRICDPATRDSYTVYGLSYLDFNEPVYFLTGKFFALIKIFTDLAPKAFRLFNILLFLSLTILAVGSRKKLLFLFLLISPQIWYIFSYVNNDAFPLFLAFLFVWQVVSENSAFQNFLKQPKILLISGGLWVGLLLGLLAISKPNYLVFVGFACFWLFFLFWTGGKSYPLLAKKIGLILGVVFAIFLIRSAINVSVNGLDKSQKVAVCAEQIAEPRFKPSHAFQPDPSSRYHSKDRGQPFTSVLFDKKWYDLSYRGSFGYYGYMFTPSLRAYYLAVGGLLILLILYLMVKFLPRADVKEKILAAGTLFFILATLVISLLNSWFIDFQPQGKYLFPILPMLALWITHKERYFNKIILMLFILALFLLSVYSFIFSGITYIPR